MVNLSLLIHFSQGKIIANFIWVSWSKFMLHIRRIAGYSIAVQERVVEFSASQNYSSLQHQLSSAQWWWWCWWDNADDDNDDDDDDGGEVVTLQRKFLRLGSILSFCPDEKSKNPTRWLRGRGSSANSSRPEFEFLIRTLPPLLQLRRLHIESNIC